MRKANKTVPLLVFSNDQNENQQSHLVYKQFYWEQIVCATFECHVKHSHKVKIKWTTKPSKQINHKSKLVLSLFLSVFFRSAFSCFFFSIRSSWFDGKLIEHFYIRNGHCTEVYDVLVDHHRRVLLMNLVIVSLRLPWNRYGRIDFQRNEIAAESVTDEQNAFFTIKHTHTQTIFLTL